MRTVCLVLFAALGSGLRSHAALLTENAALRHQLAVLERQARGRPRLRPVDRLFWAWLSRLWPGWRQALTMPGLAIRDGLNRSDRTEYAAFFTVRIGLGPSRATGRENLFWPSAEPHLCVIAAWLCLLGSEVLIRVYLKGIVRYPVPLSIREEHFLHAVHIDSQAHLSILSYQAHLAHGELSTWRSMIGDFDDQPE